jgi:TonB-linked SusC/RagA family outer membrane protein
MKKIFDFWVYTHPNLKKLIMQLKIAFIICVTCVTNILATSGYSQMAKVSLDMERKSLEQVMDEIELQSEFYFIFNQKQIDVNKVVDIHVENKLITDILPELFNGTNVNYAVFDRKILLTTDPLDNNLVSSGSGIELQQTTIKGTIKDATTGEPLPGVNIVVVGTVTGAITDLNGSFTITVPNTSASLQVSFIGYVTQEVALAGRTTLEILMASDVTRLEEVVVVGYGTQKKINLTGSISATSTKELAARAATNASDLLQGRISGLEIIQPTGQPGRDDAVMKVRGLGSFGASSTPLVLVDGVIGSLSNLAPNDIESVTVLKDAASASIYGARAANGVILVVTKHAQKGASFEYQVDMSSQRATRLPDLVTNSADYMEFYNAARRRAKQAELYTADEIAAYRNATDKIQYPNFDWMDYYFNPAQAVNHYLAFSNVTDRSNFKASFNYLNQDGILPEINFKKYNFQINASNQLTKKIKVGIVVSGFYKLNHEPPGWDVTGALSVYQCGPNYMPTLPDGSGRLTAWAYPKEGHNATSPAVFTGHNGERLTQNYGMNSQLYLDVDLIKGLKWSTKIAYNFTANKIKDHVSTTHEHYYYFKLPGEADYSLAPVTSPSSSGGVTDQYQISTLPTVNSILNYETQFAGSHNLRAMVGFEQQSYYYQYVSAKRASFPTNALAELNAGSATGSTNAGSANEWALRGFFGRVGYDYRGKYLIEVDARYDGTSRVAEANRWGFFPSLSAGWRLSEENFIKDNVNWLDNLKVRGSYGILGNQEIGNYPYQDILSLSSYGFASGLAQTVHYTRLTDQELRWESTRVLDFGLDVDMKKGLFGMTFDWFKKYTYDILTTLPVPRSLGISGPVTNDGELQNIGYELELRHRNHIGEVTYDVNFMVSHYANKLMKIAVPTTGVNEVGLPYNSIFVYEFNGVFDDQADIDASPTQVLKVPQPGDVKVKDQNGDGKVDSKDRISLTPYPKYTYSFGINVGWKGFNLSTFFQGIQKLNTLIYGWGIDPFVQMDPPNVKYYDSWSPENPTSDIPAVWLGSGGTAGNNGYLTTYHVPDASYLRLKNINLSYTLPKQITDKIRLQELTVILSGDNVLTFTKFPGIDPELPSQSTRGSAYPQITIYNIGLRVKF